MVLTHIVTSLGETCVVSTEQCMLLVTIKEEQGNGVLPLITFAVKVV